MAEEPVLSDLVATLDPALVRVAQAGGELAVPVSDVTILDRRDPQTIRTGAVVLAVSVDPGGDEAAAVVDRAGRSGAAAVALQTEAELPARLCEIAAVAGITLLAVPPEMAWGQLYALVRTAMASAGAAHDRDAAGVSVGDLFALADAVAAAVGAPVTIEDAWWRVLAYSNLDQPIDEPRRQTILGRSPPPEWRQRLEDAGVMQALRTGTGVVRFEYANLAPRIAAPVRAGSELLGSIWIAESTGRLDAAAVEELERFAALAAVHLIAHRASEDIRRRARGTYVRELLEGRVPSGPALRLAGRALNAVAFRLHPDAPAWSGDPERILSIVALYAESLDADAMCARLEDCVWALIPTPTRHARERLLDAAGRAVARVEQTLGATLLAGVGSSVPRVADLPRSRHAAELAVAVLARRATASGAVHIDDVRAHAALLELLTLAEQHPALADGAVAVLADHDRRHRTEHVRTLRAYLDAHGDVAAAAKRLGVHQNTLRYRLRRLTELARLRLDDPDERFMAELELRLHERRADA